MLSTLTFMTIYKRSFSYSTCSPQKVTLEKGTYVLEVWGASGGTYYGAGGLGGYAKGTLSLNKPTIAYVHVGGQATTYGTTSGGCNGGGYATSSGGRSGGGATDIRLVSDSLYSRVIVAGGGGGGADSSREYGGFGGGEKGGDGGNCSTSMLKYTGKGAGQNSETKTCADNSATTCPIGIFGYGGNATGGYAGAAGGGWFGGSASSSEEGGGGGSGYVFTEKSFRPTGFKLTEEFYLTNTSLIGGDKSFPNTAKTGTETGHSGNGYAIIEQIKAAYYPSSSISNVRHKEQMTFVNEKRVYR